MVPLRAHGLTSTRLPVGSHVTVTWQRYKTSAPAGEEMASGEGKKKPERSVRKVSRYGSRTAQVE